MLGHVGHRRLGRRGVDRIVEVFGVLVGSGIRIVATRRGQVEFVEVRSVQRFVVFDRVVKKQRRRLGLTGSLLRNRTRLRDRM
ncbi:MAG: hypothetical protein AAGL98_03155 [Planctomycetota bacterium]